MTEESKMITDLARKAKESYINSKDKSVDMKLGYLAGMADTMAVVTSVFNGSIKQLIKDRSQLNG